MLKRNTEWIMFLCCEYKIVSSLKYSGRTKASGEILCFHFHVKILLQWQEDIPFGDQRRQF